MTKEELKAKIVKAISQQGNQSGLDCLDDILNAIVDAVNDTTDAVAPEYEKTTYAKGAIRFYNGKLYKAKAAIETAEDWTPAHWEETTIAAELAS